MTLVKSERTASTTDHVRQALCSLGQETGRWPAGAWPWHTPRARLLRLVVTGPGVFQVLAVTKRHPNSFTNQIAVVSTSQMGTRARTLGDDPAPLAGKPAFGSRLWLRPPKTRSSCLRLYKVLLPGTWEIAGAAPHGVSSAMLTDEQVLEVRFTDPSRISRESLCVSVCACTVCAPVCVHVGKISKCNASSSSVLGV